MTRTRQAEVPPDQRAGNAPARAEAKLRIATFDDALCIGVLATQVFLDTYATQGIRPALAREALALYSTAAIAALLQQSATVFVVAESAGHMLGFAQFTHGATHPLVGPSHATELDRLYVQERFSGFGIGTQLLRHAEATAAAHGAATLWLTAWVGNHRALRYYTNRGYVDVGPAVYTFNDEHFENRVFRRALSP
ncbi:MAG: GNAT family N-acetyltransferase [Betaproteobacteria bacterium]